MLCERIFIRQGEEEKSLLKRSKVLEPAKYQMDKVFTIFQL